MERLPSSGSGKPTDNAAGTRVKGRSFDFDRISGDQTRKPTARIASDVSGKRASSRDLYPEHGIRQDFPHHSLDPVGRVVHSAVITSVPEFRMAMVCSKWADRLPSRVATVHPSSRTSTSGRPKFTMGSMQIAMPGSKSRS